VVFYLASIFPGRVPLKIGARLGSALMRAAGFEIPEPAKTRDRVSLKAGSPCSSRRAWGTVNSAAIMEPAAGHAWQRFHGRGGRKFAARISPARHVRERPRPAERRARTAVHNVMIEWFELTAGLSFKGRCTAQYQPD
jgi:hypothetical protein